MTTGTTGTATPDLTLMHAAHEAFRRDAERLRRAAGSGRGRGTISLEGWQVFRRFLDIHHRFEDEYLWPPLRPLVRDLPGAALMLDAMEEEHQRLNPVLDAIEARLYGHLADTGELPGLFDELATVLGGHLEHEEREALPLVEQRLPLADWKVFSDAQRKAMGLSGAAEFFPWLVDARPQPAARAIRGMLPPPVRAICRLVWEPRYARRTTRRPVGA